ncbi:MAG: 6-phosphogluconolactonase, partial [Alphaproteobacteria bacterium]|nr:6-phosphogluconolactonase [Alphaproteobacteria bacterium]
MKTFDQDDDIYIGESVHFQSFADKTVLAQHLANDVADMLRAGIAERGTASMVVSGGSTPKPFFEALAKEKLDWENIYITLADERWVDGDHPDSNEALVRECFPDNARIVVLKSHADTPHAGYSQSDAQLDNIPRPFDVVILGMGDDGHTASFFPHSEGLNEALNPETTTISCALIIPPEYAPHPRITLNLPPFLNSTSMFMQI